MSKTIAAIFTVVNLIALPFVLKLAHHLEASWEQEFLWAIWTICLSIIGNSVVVIISSDEGK